MCYNNNNHAKIVFLDEHSSARAMVEAWQLEVVEDDIILYYLYFFFNNYIHAEC